MTDGMFKAILCLILVALVGFIFWLDSLRPSLQEVINNAIEEETEKQIKRIVKKELKDR